MLKVMLLQKLMRVLLQPLLSTAIDDIDDLPLVGVKADP